MMHAEILPIGDEIVSGQIVDTNSPWLSARLEELGVHVLYHTSVGDEIDPLADTFRLAVARSDIVIATGGLGPTADDLTRPALAKAVGRKLVTDQQALEHIRQMFARRKRPMPKSNEVQAEFPEGSRVVRNPSGTAPGIELDAPRPNGQVCRVVCLPGVPAEMKEMWHDSVAARLRQFGAGKRLIRRKLIKCFGAGESQMEAMLPEGFLRSRRPAIGITASQTSIIFRLSGEGTTEAECFVDMQPAIATIRERLGNLVFGEDDDELEHAVVRLLRQQKKTLAVAEWGTAGLVSEWLGAVPESDAVFRGGLVAASAEALKGPLGIAAELLERHAPGSREVVEAMAAGARQRFGVDLALAAGRFPPLDPSAKEPKPVVFALAGPAGVTAREVPFAGHPAVLKVYCAKQALNTVRLAMMGK
jgi:nicotinamide-nucleotide amidase